MIVPAPHVTFVGTAHPVARFLVIERTRLRAPATEFWRRAGDSLAYGDRKQSRSTSVAWKTRVCREGGCAAEDGRLWTGAYLLGTDRSSRRVLDKRAS